MRASCTTRDLLVFTAGILMQCATLSADARVCVLEEVQKLIASDAAAGDHVGSAVSISEGRAIVGAWAADSMSGSAYVFRRDDNGTPSAPADDFWVEQAELTPAFSTPMDLFGWSVAISGDRAVVGARWHPYPPRSGVAYIFRLDDNGTPLDPRDDLWMEDTVLIASDAAPDDEFGTAVSIDGDRVIVGASENDDACRDEPDEACDSGSAYVFRRDDNGTPLDPGDDRWVEEAKLTASDTAAGDNFGFAVSISGDRVVVGAWHDDDAGNNSGSAYVFRRDDNATPSEPTDDSWVEEDKLTASDAAGNDNFGIAVSISGDRAIVGSWLDDDAGSFSGSAYVFRRDDNGTPTEPGDDFWVQEDKLTASDAAAGDEFGKSVSIDGDRAAVGAYEDDDACADDPDPDCDSGSAYVFRRDDNGTRSDAGDDFWVQTAKLTASDTAADDFFGRVAISGDHVIAGSLDDEAGEDAGSAYIFLVARACAGLADFADFQNCITGDGGGVPPGCDVFESDGDGDVDLKDYGRFLLTFTGP